MELFNLDRIMSKDIDVKYPQCQSSVSTGDYHCLLEHLYVQHSPNPIIDAIT